MPDLPTGTVTLLFSDIEGSTRLLQQQGERYGSLLNEYRDLLRSVFAGHGGYEVDTQGDSFFVAFPRAGDSVAAAIAAQRAIATHPWPEGVAFRTRMGLHTGEPQVQAGNYVGIDVHRAARLMAAGYGGQVLLSQATQVLVAHDLPDGVTLRDLGAHRLRTWSIRSGSTNW
ncbi:MAG: adenylate/guanylate cyclase domain-containing protein [Chloroflexota bacterium]|nr:adenylate/guanylate cyclase domain-containing protein [Chloroflexota bacterium]